MPESTIQVPPGPFQRDFQFSEIHLDQFQQILQRLSAQVSANFAFIVDQAGQLVCTCAEKNPPDSSILGSLVAADLAATQEIARLCGENKEYPFILHEGEKSNLVIAEAGKALILIVSTPRAIPIGWVRKMAQSTVSEILKQMLQTELGHDAPKSIANEDKLSDLFSDALDQVWKE